MHHGDGSSLWVWPESGEIPPAITGLVALAIAKSGLTVDFYSKNADGGGISGLNFLKNGWKFILSYNSKWE